jgi:hypothetical protein
LVTGPTMQLDPSPHIRLDLGSHSVEVRKLPGSSLRRYFVIVGSESKPILPSALSFGLSAICGAQPVPCGETIEVQVVLAYIFGQMLRVPTPPSVLVLTFVIPRSPLVMKNTLWHNH